VRLANSPQESPRRLQNLAMIPVLNSNAPRIRNHPDAFGGRAAVHRPRIAALLTGF
jgi:hypothetical protein